MTLANFLRIAGGAGGVFPCVYERNNTQVYMNITHACIYIHVCVVLTIFLRIAGGAGGVFSCVYNKMNNTIVYEHLYTYTFIYMNISCHGVKCTLIT